MVAQFGSPHGSGVKSSKRNWPPDWATAARMMSAVLRCLFWPSLSKTLSEFANFSPGFDKVDDKVCDKVFKSRLLQQALAGAASYRPPSLKTLDEGPHPKALCARTITDQFGM